MAKTTPIRTPLRAAPALVLASTLAIAAAFPGVASAAAAAERPAANGGTNACRRLPPGQRLVKLNLKPDTELGDLIVWISSITCKQFLLPGTISANKRVTIVAPQLLSPEEAYRLFLSALDSVGLTVYPMGKFLRVIETSKAKTSAIPLYVSEPAASKL